MFIMLLLYSEDNFPEIKDSFACDFLNRLIRDEFLNSLQILSDISDENNILTEHSPEKAHRL